MRYHIPITTLIKLIMIGKEETTGTGFLLRIIKFSARPVKNLVNLCARIRSISSACLILILIRIELIDGSIRTCSFSFRAMCIGFSMISDDVL